MKGLMTRRQYDLRKRNRFDALMFAWALAVMLVLYSNGGMPLVAYLDPATGDVVVPPTCEACKYVEPGSVEDWICWLIGCLK